jgi:heme O synthase-like polyprenyltransferase
MNSRSIDEPGSPAEPIPGGSRSDLWQSGHLWARNSRNFWYLTKPKVVGAIVFTAVVSMMMATTRAISSAKPRLS